MKQLLANTVSSYNLSMPYSFEEVRQLAHQLPPDQQILLAESLLSGTGPADEQLSAAEVDAAWGDEIKRRLDEIDSGKAKMGSHEKFVADLDAYI